MKTKDFKVRHFCISLAAAFFAIAVVFASCINSVSYKKSSSVAVVLPASRAILEDTATSASFNGGTFAISITGTGGGSGATLTKTAGFGQTVIFEDLEPGKYQVTGEYSENDECLAYGKTTATVIAEQQTLVALDIALNKVSRLAEAIPVYTGRAVFESADELAGYDYKSHLSIEAELSNGYKDVVSASAAESLGFIFINDDSAINDVDTTLTNGSKIVPVCRKLAGSSNVYYGAIFLKAGTANSSVFDAINKIAYSKENASVKVSGAIDEDDIEALAYTIRDFSNAKIALDIADTTGVTELSYNADFEGCARLSSIALPASIETIGSGAFDGCTSLTSVVFADAGAMWEGTYLSDTITFAVNDAEQNAQKLKGELKDYEITKQSDSSSSGGDSGTTIQPEPTTKTLSGSIDEVTSQIASNTDVDLEITVTGSVTAAQITDLSNALNNLKNGHTAKVDMSGVTGITQFSDNAFSYCEGISEIILPNTITTIGESLFMCCANLKTIDLSLLTSLSSLGDYCFSTCTELTSITLPNSLTTLGEECFSMCEALTGISIPASVTTIEKNCFKNCSTLTYVEFKDTIKSWIGTDEDGSQQVFNPSDANTNATYLKNNASSSFTKES